MNRGMVRVALTVPEREIFDIIFNNAEEVQIGNKTVSRFRMLNGQLQETFQGLAQTYFDNDVGEARAAMEECVEKLVSANCVRMIARRKDAEPPGVLQLEVPHDRIEIVDRIVIEQQEEPQPKEEQMAVTNETVVDFLERKRQALIDTGNEELQALLAQLAKEKKGLGEKIASGDMIDATQYNKLRDQVASIKAEIECSSLSQAFDQVIRALEQDVTPDTAPETAAPPDAPKPKRQRRAKPNSIYSQILAVLSQDPHFGAGGEGTLHDIEKTLKKASSCPPQRHDISFRLSDLIKDGFMEKRLLTREEKNRLSSGRLQCAFKLTAKALESKDA